jgi:hypothetical protein
VKKIIIQGHEESFFAIGVVGFQYIARNKVGNEGV